MDYVNINDFNDVQIAARMRNCNYEKFKTLVRMHLSFELELNTDEFDLPCHEIVYEDKGKFKKWNRLSKKHKQTSGSSAITGCAAAVSSKSVGNSPSDGWQQQIDAGFLMHLEELKSFLLMEKNLTQEGIFRKTGSSSRQNELRTHIQHDAPLELEQGGYSAHDCATVFKGFLAELPEPLLTDAHYPAHLQIAPLCINSNAIASFSSSSSSSSCNKPVNPERLQREQHVLSSVQLLLLLLPEENRQLMQHIIEMLHAVAAHEPTNKMSADNLATLFAPHLICPRNLPPEALHYVAKKMSSIIAYMISKGAVIFEVPAKLSTDIRAYFLERKRKKTMSPEQTLDESISDMSTVNTVYTFIDRERQAAALNTNTTDTELAQLYAHIQSMPESSKKRRLIKQFNKQNGQGTPLQLVVMNRKKNSEVTRSAKSIGDSIKKHIFHKSLMSRTPKRQSTMTPVNIGTPNYAQHKNQKMRVLFQSPTPCRILTDNSAKTTSSSALGMTHTSTSLLHPLKKSKSSTSLLLKSVDENELIMTTNTIENQSNCCNSYPNGATSAPVSRQISNETDGSVNNPTVSSCSSSNVHDDCCVTPLKLLSAAAKQLIGGEKKSVVWNEEIDEYSNPCTPIQQQHQTYEHEQHSGSSLKSRYKSEPNLSRILREKITAHNAVVGGNDAVHELTPKLAAGKSLTRKLIKGVSMGNLRFPFSTPESTKRLVRSVSATLKQRTSDEASLPSSYPPLLEHTDDNDDTFDNETHDQQIDCDDQDNVDSVVNSVQENVHADDDTVSEDVSLYAIDAAITEASIGGSNSSSASYHQQSQHLQANIYRNMDLITSTPSTMLGRRSMSPITKSTQRMPKAMQESIMTPRSRKPVMVLTTNLGVTDPNQTFNQTELSSFREQDEDDSITDSSSVHVKHLEPPQLHSEDANSLGSYSDILRRQQYQQQQQAQQPRLSFAKRTQQKEDDSSTSNSIELVEQPANDALSNNFKEYLLTRSVLTASPVDSSFSSQPDDFGGAGSTTKTLEDLDESQLSPSLLYCLDGNEPENVDDSTNDIQIDKAATPNISTSNTTTTTITLTSRTNYHVASNPFVVLNNARKRAASNDILKSTISPGTSSGSTTSKINTTNNASNKENFEHVDGYLLTKKLLITDYPGETSF